MEYKFFDLGKMKEGDTVEVTVSGASANVRLMDAQNFQLFKDQKEFTYFGGVTEEGTKNKAIPHNGNWILEHDMKGIDGQAKVTVRVLNK